MAFAANPIDREIYIFKELSSEEVMARIAFQFARLYIEANTRNDEVNDILTGFEQKLNDILVKVQREDG